MKLHALKAVKMPAPQARSFMAVLTVPRPFGASEIKNEPVDVSGIPAEWFRPKSGPNDVVLLYLHGGGYVFGSIDTNRDLINRITLAAGCQTLAINYRLAPEHPFPAAVEDCVKALQWLLEQGVSPDRIVIGGDSSGGGLALASMLSQRDAGGQLPAAATIVSPWVDLELKGETVTSHERYSWGNRAYLQRWASEYLQNADPRDPLASPVYADLHDLPPMLVQVGARELLASEVDTFADNAQSAGVEVTLTRYDDAVHGFQLMASLFPQGVSAIDEMGRFVRERGQSSSVRSA